MGLAVDAGRRALHATATNLTFVGVTFLVGLLMTGVALVLSLVPFVGPMLGNVLVVPTFVAGMIAMADGALDGRASLGDFTDGVSGSWKRMIGAYGVLYLAFLSVAIAVMAVFAGVGVLTLGLGAASGVDPGAGMNSLFAGLGLAFVGGFLLLTLVGIVVGLAIQFLPAAVVVGGESATGSFGACWRLLRRRPVSVLGYTLLLAGSWIGASVAIVLLYAVGVTVADELAALLLAGVVALAVYPFLQAFFLAYQAAFYRAATGE